MKTAVYRVTGWEGHPGTSLEIQWLCCGSEDTNPHGYKFCPFCGATGVTKLECRESSTPRWAYERPHLDWVSLAALARMREGLTWPVWVLEETYKSFSGEWADWKAIEEWEVCEQPCFGPEYNSPQTTNILSYAKSEFERNERIIVKYRLRLGDKVMHPSPYAGTTLPSIWPNILMLMRGISTLNYSGGTLSGPPPSQWSWRIC